LGAEGAWFLGEDVLARTEAADGVFFLIGAAGGTEGDEIDLGISDQSIEVPVETNFVGETPPRDSRCGHDLSAAVKL
jgi:hypothetical protein